MMSKTLNEPITVNVRTMTWVSLSQGSVISRKLLEAIGPVDPRRLVLLVGDGLKPGQVEDHREAGALPDRR